MTVARDKGLRSLLEKRLPLTITTSRGDKQPPVGTSELVLWEDTSQRAMKILLRSGGKIYVFTTEMGIGNSAAATTLGTVTKKFQVYDESGNNLSFVPVYDAIT